MFNQDIPGRNAANETQEYGVNSSGFRRAGLRGVITVSVPWELRIGQ